MKCIAILLSVLLALVVQTSQKSIEGSAQTAHEEPALHAEVGAERKAEPAEGTAEAKDRSDSASSPIVGMTIRYTSSESSEPVEFQIRIELYEEKLPRTTANFKALCRGVSHDGKKYGYVGTYLHRIVPGFVVQGGDVENKNGHGGFNIHNKDRPFEDEGFFYSHNEPGLLSMANAGPDTNSSQFFITLANTSFLDGKHVVFGKLVDGMDALLEMVKHTKYTTGSSNTKDFIFVTKAEVDGETITGEMGVPMPLLEEADADNEEDLHSLDIDRLFASMSYDSSDDDYETDRSSTVAKSKRERASAYEDDHHIKQDL